MSRTTQSNDVEAARVNWIKASEAVSQLAAQIAERGGGYGAGPHAHESDQDRLASARLEAERLFREYHDLDRRDMERQMLELQRSQRLATWASFAVAAVVGLATVVSTLIALFK